MNCKQIYAVILPCICIISIVVKTAFMQFLHYDSQYRIMNPKHYNVEVITQDDYKKLSSSEGQSVTLSNDKTVSGRTEAWHSNVLPKYKPVNDSSSYVLVTVRGTAPFIHHWYSGILPILVLCLLALFYGLRANKQAQFELNKSIEETS